MNKDVNFYVVRHGETIYNVMNRVQGWSDTPLTSKGIEVAELMGRGLKDVIFDAIYSSDSGRAIETANIIIKQNKNDKLKLQSDKRLREWGFGIFEGQSNKYLLDKIKSEMSISDFKELNHKLPEIAKIIKDTDDSGFAEEFPKIKTRLESVFKEIADSTIANGGGNILIVTHAFLIKTLIYIFANTRVSEVSKIENASVTKIIYKNGKFEVTDINDTHYIK